MYNLIEMHKVRSSNKSICDTKLDTPAPDHSRLVQSQALDDKNRMINGYNGQGTHTKDKLTEQQKSVEADSGKSVTVELI